jgi:hypothetical protein
VLLGGAFMNWKVTAAGESDQANVQVSVGWQVQASTALGALRAALQDAEAASLVSPRSEPPMPSRADVALTVREDGSHEGLPVMVVTFTDVLGDARTMHLSDEVARELALDLIVAHRQLVGAEAQVGAAMSSDRAGECVQHCGRSGRSTERLFATGPSGL